MKGYRIRSPWDRRGSELQRPRVRPLDFFIRQRQAEQHRLHLEGECAGIRCPWCDYERQAKGGR